MYLNEEHAIRKCFETLERNGLKIATYGDNVPATGSKLTIGECHVNAAWVVKWIMELPAHQGLALRLKYGCDAELHRLVAQDLASFVVMEVGRASINKAQAYFILSMWARGEGSHGGYIDSFDVSADSATRHVRKVYDIVERWRREGMAALYPRLSTLIDENVKVAA